MSIITTNLFLASSGGTMLGDLDLADNQITEPKLKDASAEVVSASNVSGTYVIDLEQGNFFALALSGATTLSISNAITSGDAHVFYLEITSSGNAVTFPASVDWVGGVAPTLSSSGADTISLYTRDGGARWHAAL